MSDLESRFTKAQEEVKGLSQRPDENTLLKLYALFKQATEGDATGEPPSAFDFVRRAKYNAWSSLKGTPKKASMEQYVQLVETLRQ
jgi:diazepam-binding inhibitor (GABA receptor modulator, acyl-CoA-binding protein)